MARLLGRREMLYRRTKEKSLTAAEPGDQRPYCLGSKFANGTVLGGRKAADPWSVGIWRSVPLYSVRSMVSAEDMKRWRDRG